MPSKRKQRMTDTELRVWLFEQTILTDKGCREWQRGRTAAGYGHVYHQGRMVYAHRLSYVLWMGVIPDGKDILHRCDNRLCIEPNHLYIGTNLENARDREERNPGCQPKGEFNGRAKLDAVSVRRIRQLAATGMSQREIAAMYEIGKRTVAALLTGVTWSHVDG